MKLIDLFIKRPVMTTMLIVTIIFLGAFSYTRLGVDQYPNIDFPFVLVRTTLTGADPEQIETSVTKVLEDSINSVAGIEELQSSSYEGMSMIFVKFELEKDIDVAAQEVRDKVSLVQNDLPEGFDQPVIMKFDATAIAIMNIVVSGDKDMVELTELAKTKIKENVETVSGVGEVSLVGKREREVHVIINPLRLAASNITVAQVKAALAGQNIEVPGGKVEQKETTYNIRTLGRIEKVEDFADIVVKTENGVPIKISDLGTVEDTGEFLTTSSFFNGKPCVTVIVKKQSGTNTVEITKNVHKRLDELQASGVIPPDMNIAINGEQSKFILTSVNTVKEHLLLGALCAALMVLLFMGDFRSTIIASLAIPTSVIGTFTLMHLAGFTLNVISLLGLTISVGIVIDDAIVMLENIYRHMEEYKKNPMQAALDGGKEIGFAVIAMSASLLVIFLPIAYMSGIVGRFMISYGLTVAFAITISTVVALTFTPMLCSRFLKVHGEGNKLARISDSVNNFLIKYYAIVLEWALHHRKTMVVASIILILSSIPLFMAVGKDFVPQEDSSQFTVTITAPTDVSLDKMERIFKQLESDLEEVPYIKDVLSIIGLNSRSTEETNKGYMSIELVDVHERDIGMEDIMHSVRKLFSKYTDLAVTVSEGAGMGAGEAQLQLGISGPDLLKLEEYGLKMVEMMKADSRFVDVDLNVDFAKPEYLVRINRDKMHNMGGSINEIASTIRTVIGGQDDITKFKEGKELYQVRLRAAEDYRNRPDIIKGLPIAIKDDLVVRLDSVVSIEEGVSPTTINHYAKERQVVVRANPASGIDMGTAIGVMNEYFNALGTSPEYRGRPIGMAQEMGKMMNSFMVAFVMAFVLIYIILAAQFESFMHPLAIIVCLPLTIPCALISLVGLGQPLTLFSIMGLFMLVGIVKKNGILQVDYTNQLRAKGMPREQAIMQANKTRLRPILMTTFTLVGSMFPTALATGAGTAGSSTMAWTIVGGQMLSLLITLLMTPVTYSLLDDLQNWLSRKFGIKSHEDLLKEESDQMHKEVTA